MHRLAGALVDVRQAAERARAAGRPVLINYGGWQADIVRETGAGLVLDPHDLDAAKAALLQALRDEAWLKEAGQRARKLAADRFSRDVLAANLLAVLEDAYREHSAKRR